MNNDVRKYMSELGKKSWEKRKNKVGELERLKAIGAQGGKRTKLLYSRNITAKAKTP